MKKTIFEGSQMIDVRLNRQSLFLKNLFHSKLETASSNKPRYASLFEEHGDVVGWNHATEITYMFSSRLIHAGYVVGFNLHDVAAKDLRMDVLLNVKGGLLYETSTSRVRDLNILFTDPTDISSFPKHTDMYDMILNSKNDGFHEPEMLSPIWLTLAMVRLQIAVESFSIRKNRSHDFLVPVMTGIQSKHGAKVRIFAWAIFSHYFCENAHARNLIKTPVGITCIS